jgi:hypothetical protein
LPSLGCSPNSALNEGTDSQGVPSVDLDAELSQSACRTTALPTSLGELGTVASGTTGDLADDA